ncbi:MAG: glutamine--fructose-6-phosphate transaminase (isomerizing) [Chloroflexia bacterium]|nr:glutamine--fructose-6-phosphate transaminase (isomerizing) [Chloroflexia bacterium]
MCGIVGYVGPRQALSILLQNLNLLTYRGYDSAGVVVSHNGTLYIEKTAGKVSALEALIGETEVEGHVGIGHTRWATHGPPTTLNAHPHTDCQGRIAVVHNGIIENYYVLRQELLSQGHKFTSETDTEVLAHLIEAYYQGDLGAAVRRAMQRVRGAMAMVVLHSGEPDKIVAAKLDTPPLIVGLGQRENFVASDIPALLKYTNKVYILEDGEVAEITRDGVRVSSFLERPSRRVYQKQVTVIEWTPDMAEQGSYAHYMLKEIHEQPTTIQDTLRGRLDEPARRVYLENFLSPQQVQNAHRITFVACGTAYHAALVAKYLFEQVLRIPTEVDVGSEYRYRYPIVENEDIVVAISQSGETADTIASAREAQSQGATIVAITNVVGSTISRMADAPLYIRAGPEIAVASTKAFVGQLIGIYLLLLYFGQFRRPQGSPALQQILAELPHLAAKAQRILDDTAPIERLAQEISRSKACFFIGRHLDEPIAREGSLKLKEISYIHSQGYAAGELKHGTLALMERETPVVALATQENLYEKMLSNIQEVLARSAPVIPLIQEHSSNLEVLPEPRIVIPRTNDYLAPVLSVIPLQLLAYYCAVALDRDVDQPRNLAKSVTVE